MIPGKEQSQLNKGICVPKENAFHPAARAYKTGPDLSGEESGPKKQRSCARWILQQQLDMFLTGQDKNLQCFCGLVPDRAECWGRSILAVFQRPRSSSREIGVARRKPVLSQPRACSMLAWQSLPHKEESFCTRNKVVL